MKFTIIVVVMLAIALAAEASVISWAPHHHSEWSAWGNGLWGGHNHHNAWHGDWQDDHHHAGAWDDGHHWSHGPSHTHGISLAQHGHGWDHHHHHHAPAHIDVHHAHHDDHHHGHHHDGHYIAKTLGAVHTAPLPGHIASVNSLNVASAPGTH